MHLDTQQEQAQLAALEAQRDLARLNFNRMSGLVADGAVSRAEYDLAEAEHKQSDARVGEIRATIERKTIRAPFTGILGLRQVNLGQYLDGGDAGRASAVAASDLCELRRPAAGRERHAGRRKVQVTAADVRRTRRAQADHRHRFVVDETTRNIQVQATLANPKGQLRPGMFVQTQVVLGASQTVMALPASSISYAPYGDSVFVVTDLKDPNGKTYRGVRQQFVKLGGSRGDQSRGRLRRQGRRGGRDLRRLQAPQRRRCPRQQQGQTREQPGTQAGGQLNEVHRSVRQATRSRDRRQSGDPDRGPAVDSRR